MTQEEMRKKFDDLYRFMAASNKVEYMHTFGNVQKEMMEWMIANKPEMAQEYIDKLCAIKWGNYLTRKEADMVVSSMKPDAPWTQDQWRSAMEQHGHRLEEPPFYNSCSLYAVMNMVYSDSYQTLTKYVSEADLFDMVYELAIDKLKDEDGRFNVRTYLGV